MSMCCCRGKKSLEERFPHHNMVIVLLIQLLNGTAYYLVTPSIYKFITTPTTRPEELQCKEGRFWPGLGGSDTDYAWVLISFSLFEVFSMPLAATMLHLLPFTATIFTFLTLYIAGGVVYALADNVWMVFVGLGLIGAGIAFSAGTVHTYIGEMGTVMDDIRKKQGKKPRKFVLYLAYSFMLNGGVVIPFSITSIMAQFDIDPYHWPGWIHAALSAAVSATVLLFFTETRSLSRAKCSTMRCTCLARLKLSAQLHSKWKSYVFLAACGYTVGQVYSILATLVTPVLSDKFGLNVEYTSHFLLALSSAYITSSLLQLGARLAKIDNRTLLGLCLLLALVGSVLMGDWQSIGHDPCFSSYRNSSSDTSQASSITSNISLENIPCSSTSFNTTTSDPPQIENASISHLEASGATKDYVWPEDSATNAGLPQQLVKNCEALSNSKHTCYWNRQSDITRRYCYTCLATCLSRQKSQNIYQFSIGALFLCISAPVGFVLISAIASEITSVKSQGKVVALILGMGSFARACSPFWLVESYELTGRHTYFATAISAGCALVLLLSLATLHKNLAPKSKHNKDKDDDDLTISATCKLSFVVTESEIPGSEDILAVSQNEVLYETPL